MLEYVESEELLEEGTSRCRFRKVTLCDAVGSCDNTAVLVSNTPL